MSRPVPNGSGGLTVPTFTPNLRGSVSGARTSAGSSLSSTTVTNEEVDKAKQILSARAVKEMHKKADTDSSAFAIHHTLGVKHDQASPGDHLHDGINSRLLLEGITLTGSKGGNVALANLITILATTFGLTDNTT